MTNHYGGTLYDCLDISPDASPQEILTGYLRAKSTYSKDNPVLYTLISAEEREQTLKKIEDAYTILSDPDRRRHYDRNHGLIQLIDEIPQESVTRSHLTSPKSDSSPNRFSESDPNENLLIPPQTDFDSSAASSQTSSSSPSGHSSVAPSSLSTPKPLPPMNSSLPVEEKNNNQPVPANQNSGASSTDVLGVMLSESIEHEKEWNGSFLKRIREAYHISIEEMSETTKISKTYLIAIEDENGSKLPAAVYVRGFVSQIARVLKLPHDKVATAYTNRYRASQKFNS